MKRKLLGSSFTRTFLRQFFFSALLPLIGLSAALSIYYSRTAFDFNATLYSSMLDTAAGAMADSFNELEQISFTPYLYKEASLTVSYMHNGFCRAGAETPEYLNTAPAVSEYTMLLTKMLHSSPQHIEGITFYPLGEYQGDAYSIRRSTAGLIEEQAGREYVQRLYELTGRQSTAPVFLRLDGAEDSFSLLRVIQDFDNGRNLGIMRIDTRADALGQSLAAFDVSENSFLLLADSRGGTVYSVGTIRPELTEAALNGADTARSGGAKYHIFTPALAAPGWMLVYAVSDADMGASFAGSISIIIAMALLAFAVTYILWRIRSAGTLASIDAILEGIRQLRHGNFAYKCTVPDSEGYGMIADSLNKTGQRLHELVEAEASARESQSRSEYLALQSQINPHFLYNTLNGFIALNRMGERKLLENSIIQLTRLFRYTCSSSDISTAAQEYQFARQYLELQRLRFGEQLEYTISVEEGAGDIAIPKLIVQPIVENCVVHGMEDTGEAITVTLAARLTDGGENLCMEISDNGAGFDPALAENAPHVGLENVKRRLEMFRRGASFRIESAPGRGTRVRITIPLDGEEKA